MENFLSLLESVETSWLTPSSTTWAMDMILAFVCGLGLFCLILPLLPLDSPSPTPAENTTPQKVLRMEHRKVRKKIRTVKAYRGGRKKPKEDKVLGSHLHSMQERLVNTISICQHLGQDASGEAFKPDAVKAHLPPRQPTGKSVATMSSLETSSAPYNEHLLLKDSKPLSPVLLNSSPIESQTSECTSWSPETLTTGRRHSPPQQWAPSYPSQPLDPMAYPPPMPDLGMAVTSQSSQTLPGLPSPMPGTPGINLSRRPTLTTPGLNYSSRSTSTSLGLDHLNSPTSTTAGLNHLSRPTSTTAGLNHLSRPTSTTAGLNHLSRPTSTTAGLNHLSRPTSTTAGLNHLSRPTSTTAGLNHLSRPTSTTAGLNHLSRPTSTTSGLDHLRRPTSTTAGLEHSSRPTSGPFRYQVTSTTLCSSTSSLDESFQEDLFLTIHKASFWTGPTDSQIEPGEPSFISPVIQEMLEVQIRKRAQLKLCKKKEKEDQIFPMSVWAVCSMSAAARKPTSPHASSRAKTIQSSFRVTRRS